MDTLIISLGDSVNSDDKSTEEEIYDVGEDDDGEEDWDMEEDESKGEQKSKGA